MDFKCQWVGPSGTTSLLSPLFNSWVGILTTSTPGALSSTFTASGGAPGPLGLAIRSVIFVGGTGGTVTLQWAQNALQVADLTMMRGSSLLCYRVV